MKRLTSIFYLLFFANSISFGQSTIDYLEQTLQSAIDGCGLFSDYCLSLDQINIIGAFMESGESVFINHYFEYGNEYRIFAVGDEDVKDLDLKISYEEGGVIKEDVETSHTALIDYYCNLSGIRTIEMKNYESDAPSFCIYVILNKGYDYYSSMTKFAEAGNIFLSGMRSAGVAFTFVRNQICFWGGLFREGYESDFGVLINESGSYFCIASGSNNISDLDVAISRKPSQYSSGNLVEVCSDKSINPYAITDCFLSEQYYHKIKIKNYSSNGCGMITTFLLKNDE